MLAFKDYGTDQPNYMLAATFLDFVKRTPLSIKIFGTEVSRSWLLFIVPTSVNAVYYSLLFMGSATGNADVSSLQVDGPEALDASGG